MYKKQKLYSIKLFFFQKITEGKKITVIKIYRSKEKNVQKQKFTVLNFFYRKLPKEKKIQK